MGSVRVEAVVAGLLAFVGVGQSRAASDATLSFGTNGPASVSSGVGDSLLQAMQAELAREREQLVLPGMQRPYFIEYRLEDVHSYGLNASYGALTTETESRQRFV